MPLSPGQTINHDRYRIVGLLGQGGMGAVYRAWDLTLEVPVAIKENLDANFTSSSMRSLTLMFLSSILLNTSWNPQ